MNRMCRTVFFFLLIAASITQAQLQQPFIVTIYGGLFFPAHFQYKEVYQSNSDLIYGFGIGLPINRNLIVTGDMSFFKSEALIGSIPDSTTTFKQKFIHVGLLSRQPFNQSLALRMSGGFNYITITQSIVGPQSPEQSNDAEKKIGYFVGLGIEHLFEGGRTAVFADVIYDYRRIREVNFSGDYGGTRFVMGVHFILF